MMIIAVGAGEQIGRVLPELGALLRRPLLTLERVRVCKRDGELVERPHGPARHRRGRHGALAEAHGLHVGERPCTTASRSTARSCGGCAGRAPAARPRCAASGASTATTRRTATGCSSWAGGCPCVTVVIDTPERIAASFAVVDELTGGHGVVTSELVPAAAGGADGEGLRLARHPH